MCKGTKNFSWCLYDLILTVHYTSFACMLQLDRQNRSLKRKSMMLLSHISPETIADIDLNDEAEESEDLHASSHDCLSPQCCTSTSGTVESKAYTVLTDLTYSIHSFTKEYLNTRMCSLVTRRAVKALVHWYIYLHLLAVISYCKDKLWVRRWMNEEGNVPLRWNLVWNPCALCLTLHFTRTLLKVFTWHIVSHIFEWVEIKLPGF